MKVLALTLITLLSHAHYSVCQEKRQATGIVSDSATLEALPYVSILVKHTARGTASDKFGNFSIDVRPSDTLVFTSIGYQRLELPMWNWESAIILMKEESILLKAITIDELADEHYYEYLFEEKNHILKKASKRLPFYFSKDKKETIKVNRLENENDRVRTYVEFVVNNEELKADLMSKHNLEETRYYDILLQFNQKHHRVMYYLTASELLTMINQFFEHYSDSTDSH